MLAPLGAFHFFFDVFQAVFFTAQHKTTLLLDFLLCPGGTASSLLSAPTCPLSGHSRPSCSPYQPSLTTSERLKRVSRHPAPLLPHTTHTWIIPCTKTRVTPSNRTRFARRFHRWNRLRPRYRIVSLVAGIGGDLGVLVADVGWTFPVGGLGRTSIWAITPLFRRVLPLFFLRRGGVL